jgi:crotonobetaine/carnitine-CoA ligase
MTDGASHPAWFDTRPISPEGAIIPKILRCWANERGDMPCVQFDDGSLWSYSEAWRMATSVATGFRSVGVAPGDVVLVWLPNGPAFMRAWFGLSTLGAIHTPINVAFRGNMLEHIIRNSGATTLVAHQDLVGRLESLDLSQLKRIVICGGEAKSPRVGAVEMIEEASLFADGSSHEAPDLTTSDLAAILYTSGTTGLSKGVKIPYAQLATAGQVAHGYLTGDDRIYIFTPLFHTVGISAVFATLNKGACFHLAESFRAPSFWDDISRTGCNRILGLISSMTSYLAKAIPAGTPCPFNFAMMSPVTAETVSFAQAHGFDYFAAYSMTELSVPIVSTVNSKILGSCGRPRDGIHCRIVDASDNDCAAGEAGELIVRADDPATMNAGYLNDDAATEKSWRNGWFYTGDVFKQDADGNYFFVDRLKDAIRRRGENISSIEVELEIASYPGVMEVAVIGAPSPHGDDEVLAVVAAAPGKTIDPAELIVYLVERLAHFMVPRYVRIVDSLPKTPTNKIKKQELRDIGLPQGTWDREAHGIAVRRQKLG